MIGNYHKDILYTFLEYAKEYDTGNNPIERKTLHTMRVAMISQSVAEEAGMNEDDVLLAWFIGILHDVGRFEQERQFGTFADSDSADHAEIGADILFHDGLIHRFQTNHLPADWYRISETAVRLHNKLDLPEELDERTRNFCKLIRDADKTDIFRVVATTSFEDRAGTNRNRYMDAQEASPEVMDCVYEHRCVPRKHIRSVFDSYLSYCCMAFELGFEATRNIIKKQGFLKALLLCSDETTCPDWNRKEREQLLTAKTELEKMWGMTL